jgi:hypothetical protein
MRWKRCPRSTLSSLRATWLAALVPCATRWCISLAENGIGVRIGKRGRCFTEPAFLANLWDRHDALFRPDLFPNFAAVRVKRGEVEKEQAEFINSLTELVLGRMLPIRATRLSLAHLMQHLVNHSS